MNDLFSLKNKTALVTGASSGLGWCFATTLAQAGADVVIAARRQSKLEEVKAALESKGANAVAVSMDVTDADSIQAGFQTAEAALGGIDILVNNAGIAKTEKALDISESEWDEMINTNLRGAWLVAQTAAKHMTARGRGGNIINIASILGFRVATGVASYIAAKTALVGLTRALALEWARHDIRVNAIAPGYILTEMNREFFRSDASKKVIRKIPQRRIGQPSDLDGALLLLASDASSYMTGSTIVVDGGHLQSSL
jgi:NAD(P)-dependent dehydrogenase (short-subunit alcohol dehydrogenase family)